MTYDLSIVIPAFNVENYIERAVESVLSNDGLSIQVIIVDDGSTDNTYSLISEKYGGNPNVEIVKKKNEGLYKARATGVNSCKARYIGFIDGDDYVSADIYKDCIHLLDESAADFLEFGMQKVDERGEVLFKYNIKEAILSSDDELMNLLRRKGTSCSVCNKVYRSSIFDTFQMDENIINREEDFLMNVKVLINSNRAIRIQRIGYNYCTRVNSITKKKYDKSIYNLVDTWSQIFSLIKEHRAEMISIAAINYCAKLAFTYCVIPRSGRKKRNIIVQRFKELYKEYGLKDYNYVYESNQRKYMIKIFRFSPLWCRAIYRVMCFINRIEQNG